MTFYEIQEEGIRRLRECGMECPETDTSILLQSITKKNRSELFRDAFKTIPKQEESLFFEALTKRLNHVPVQYITGEQEFYGLPFIVNSSVLIPRPETELLTEAVIKKANGKRVLDMCTGSGCIAVAVAKFSHPELVAASDCSKEALSVARRNATLNEVKISFFEGDLFETIHEKFDIIVSNPPYIATKKLKELLPEVSGQEPLLALDGGVDGLSFYRRLIHEAKDYLLPGGSLLFEVGFDQGESVPLLFREAGYRNIEVKKDYAGLDRMVFADR